MKDNFDVNFSHGFFYTADVLKTEDDFTSAVRAAFPSAIAYDMQEEMTHPHLIEMQKAERFLHGGGQTYRVLRYLLPEFACPELRDLSVLLAYFDESDVVSLSFHYASPDVTTDEIIAIRQSGLNRPCTFGEGTCSLSDLAAEICGKLGISDVPLERSFLCEITRFGDMTDIDVIEAAEAKRLYGFLSGDEGYAFVPEELVRERLTYQWGSRDFMRIYAIDSAFLFLNLLESPSREDYLKRQVEYGTATYGGCNDYFFMESCPLTVNHGIFFSVEFVMMLKALIREVMDHQSDYSRERKESYYRRIRTTRAYRRKIIMVLEKVGNTAITEIGQLSTVLMESQRIAPVVDEVKYLLELLEGDLSLMYSERNNMLVTVLTVLGLVFAAFQVVLALV